MGLTSCLKVSPLIGYSGEMIHADWFIGQVGWGSLTRGNNYFREDNRDNLQGELSLDQSRKLISTGGKQERRRTLLERVYPEEETVSVK